MTVLDSTYRITAVRLKGLDDMFLPFTDHLVEGIDMNSPDAAFLKPLQASNDQKYYVKSIDGLSAPDRNVAIARTAAGGSFQGATTEDREIVVLIGLNPDWENGETAHTLRENLYTMMYTGYDPKIDVQLLAGAFPAFHEYGYVTKFESAIFDANPVVQLTISMLNPTFRSFAETSYDPANLSETAPNVYNMGTAETGFKFAVKFTDDMNGWYIKVAENQNIGMTFDMTFHDGDILSVSTVPGQKYVHWKKHRGKVQNKLGILRTGSEWIQLHPGHNRFVVPKKTARWDWKGKLTFFSQSAGI